MKTTFARRTRNSRSRSTSHNEGGSFFKKESEASFFDTPAPTPFFNAAAPAVQRKCEKCEEEEGMNKRKEDEKKVHRKEVSVPSSVTAATSVAAALTGTSQTLPANLAYHFGSRMGHDFSDTKIHLGSKAAASAKAIHARAYTLGNHVVFADYQYNPDTYEGKKLIAHELAHVVQQRQGTALYRMGDQTNEQPTEEGAQEEQPIATSGSGEIRYENKRDFANCAGVNVQGHTDANYSHSYTFSGTATRTTGCVGCPASQCINDTGTIVSTFSASPSVTLPSVPAGLSDCEANAVQAFINGTLAAHEQQHVAAFNTYAGTVNTPYTYTGCQAAEDAFIRARHNAVESARRAASDAASAALDANGANNFTITCDCPETDAGK
jgi:hypothetical protein